MTNRLYPIKFQPIYKEKVWGDEIWKLSGISYDETLVSNGFLIENNINELIEVYLGDLIGEKIYEKFGEEFPLLIKHLTINDRLSLQIHPDDETAAERHECYGKTECWYILDAKPTAKIYLGLNRELSPQELYDRCNNGTIEECMNVIFPQKGDLIPIVPGMLHSATGGVSAIEIQQASDVTYRVYDWERERDTETRREMHMDLAIDCINYNRVYPSELIKRDSYDSPYFKIMVIDIKSSKDKTDPSSSYRGNSHLMSGSPLYICVSGSVKIGWSDGDDTLEEGATALVPANLGEFYITGTGTILEVIPII